MKKLYIPICLALLFVFESLFSNLFSEGFFNSDYLFVPRFLIIFFVFFVVYGNRRSVIVYGAIVGLIFDITYTEILGIYLFVFPVIIYLVSKAMKVLQNNIFMVSLISLVTVVLLEFIMYGVNYILGFANETLQEFMMIRLLPTLLLNLVFIIIFAYPFKQLFVKYATDESQDSFFRKRS